MHVTWLATVCVLDHNQVNIFDEVDTLMYTCERYVLSCILISSKVHTKLRKGRKLFPAVDA